MDQFYITTKEIYKCFVHKVWCIWRSSDCASWYIDVQVTCIVIYWCSGDLHRDILTFRWLCIVIYWRSGDRASWYIDVQVTVHRDILTSSWPCIVMYWRSGDCASWHIDVQVTVHRDKLTFKWPESWCIDVQVTCIVIYWRPGDRASWYILTIKPSRRTNFSNLFLE